MRWSAPSPARSVSCEPTRWWGPSARSARRAAGRWARAGAPRLPDELWRYDAEHVRQGLAGAADVLAAAGAEEIFTRHPPPVRVRPGTPGWRPRFLGEADGRGFAGARMSYISFHQMGSAALGWDASTSVADAGGKVHGVRGLYLADASAFPTSSGVNPMGTIMALADHVGRAIAETW